ncbi:MAG: hypothetical protein ACJ8J0_24315 [Longimicrobiaceae bacterium]
MEAQIRKVMPPHPGASITFEQAVAAWKKVAEEDRQRRLRRNAARRGRTVRGKMRPLHGRDS